MNKKTELKPLVVEPNEGRTYEMGPMSAVFKADLDETDSTLSVSEWWLEPDTEGPHAHDHDEAHLFYVLQGSLSVYLQGQDWFEAKKGSYIYIPGNTKHAFENRSKRKVGFISINTPGGFEHSLPHIVDYFDENPLGNASTAK